jgi:hypothetical protein
MIKDTIHANPIEKHWSIARSGELGDDEKTEQHLFKSTSSWESQTAMTKTDRTGEHKTKPPGNQNPSVAPDWMSAVAINNRGIQLPVSKPVFYLGGKKLYCCQISWA